MTLAPASRVRAIQLAVVAARKAVATDLTTASDLDDGLRAKHAMLLVATDGDHDGQT
jgi:hypothetical protein